jgi:hypothetical protein
MKLLVNGRQYSESSSFPVKHQEKVESLWTALGKSLSDLVSIRRTFCSMVKVEFFQVCIGSGYFPHYALV